MSDDKKNPAVMRTLRIVDAPWPPQPPGGGGGDGGGDGSGGDGLGKLPGDRPVVQIANGTRPESIAEAETHLIRRDLELFARDKQIVRVAPVVIDAGEGRKAKALRIVTVDQQHLRLRFNRAVDLQRYDLRSKKWRSCDCPPDFAEAYLGYFGIWRLPPLRAVITAPTLRPNGTLLDRPGYDKETEIFYNPRGVQFPKVPAAPTRADALVALERLKGLLATFDFIDAASRSVALSGILTALLRRSMSTAPLHAFSAPVPGSGKSKLVHLASILATGHPAPVTALSGNPDEGEKRLSSSMLGGDAVIALDNIERPLGGEFLCQLLTETLINVRVLGKSLTVQVPNVFCVFATGNNLKVVGDMTRRSLVGRLDPHCERPELREFETPDPLLTALRERPELVICALTIARAFFLAGSPRADPPLGSFEEWSEWVRDPLIWLDEADPVTTIERLREEDPRLAALTSVLRQWQLAIRDDKVSARQIIERAEVGLYPDFRGALCEVAVDRSGKLSALRLGRWLGWIAGREAGGLTIERAGMLDGILRWKLTARPIPATPV